MEKFEKKNNWLIINVFLEIEKNLKRIGYYKKFIYLNKTQSGNYYLLKLDYIRDRIEFLNSDQFKNDFDKALGLYANKLSCKQNTKQEGLSLNRRKLKDIFEEKIKEVEDVFLKLKNSEKLIHSIIDSAQQNVQ